MALQGDIGIRVQAVGLQQDIANQARAAEKAISRKPISLSLDSKGFTQPLGRITGNMTEFQKSLDASTARVFAFGATVGVINGIADGFRAVADAVIQVEKALTDINVVMGLSVEQLSSFSDELFNVAKNTGQTFQTVATAATEFARQGLTADETIRRVNDSLVLTRLSGLDAAKSVEALTAVVNGFGKEGLNTTEIVNRLANVDAAFAVSSKDLADALSRAGATAQSAGVNFNELLAIVTSVQQQTARGGAVIGNAFKSIFTRLQRSKVREALEEIGVATTDSFGNFRSAIAILQDYANVYDTLSDQQQAFTAEQIAGVFQINNLKALVSDLNNEFSIYSQALNQAANTTDEATRRNEALNKTFAALAVQAGESLRELAQAFGELSLEPAMEKVLGMLQTVVDAMNSMLGEGDGDTLMSKFFKGMGSFIAGPGLALITAAFGKLFMIVVKHATDAFKEMFKITSEAQRQKGLQEAILNILMKDEQAYKKIAAAAGDQNRQSQILLGIIRQINAEYATQQKLISSLAGSQALKGVSAGPQGFVGTTKAGQKKIGTAAEGLQPDKELVFAGGAMPEIEASIDAGYVNPVQPQQVRQMNVPNLGNILYNTQERVVNLANVNQPFIVPPTSSKAYPNYAKQVTESYGEPMAKKVLGRAFTPEQRAFAEGFSPIKKLSTTLEKEYNTHASGLVPNYFLPQLSSAKLKEELIEQGTMRPKDAFDSKKVYEYRFDDGTSILGKPGELKAALSQKDGKVVKNTENRFFKQPANPALSKTLDQTSAVSMLLPEATPGDTATKINTKISGDTLTKTLGQGGRLTEMIGPSAIKRLGGEQEAKTKLNVAFANDIFNVKFSRSGVQDLENQASLREKIDSDLSQKITDVLSVNAKELISSSGLKNIGIYPQEIKGQAHKLVEANSKLTGSMFEDIITIAVGKSNEFSSQDHYRNWDFQGVSSLNELFDRRVNELADTKRQDLPHARESMAKKILMGTPLGKQTLRNAAAAALSSERKGRRTAAEGLVPKLTARQKMKAAMASGKSVIALQPGVDISLSKNSGNFSKIKFDSIEIDKVRNKIGADKRGEINLDKPAFEKYANTLPLKTTSKYNVDTRKLEDVNYVNYNQAKKDVLDGKAGELSQYFKTTAPAPTIKRQLTPEQQKEWDAHSRSIKRKSEGKKSGRYGYYHAEGLVPNLIGRANKKETSSRIYESVLATDLYNKPVNFGDTRVEKIQMAGGGMIPVAVNDQEKIYKTGADVKRAFGLATTPDGGMVLPPADTQVGRQVRSQAAESMQNAAGGLVPNFADNAYDVMVQTNPDEKINLKEIQKSLDKKQNGLLYQAKVAQQISLKATTKSLQKIIDEFGPSVSVNNPKLAEWVQSNPNNRRDFSSLAKAHDAFKAIGTGAAARNFKERKLESEDRKKHTEKQIIAAYPYKGSARPQRGFLKEPDGDRWQVDFLGTGIERESLVNKSVGFKDIINNEFSVALEKVAQQFKLSGALAQVGAEAGALRTRLKNNIESTQLSTITGNVFDIVIKTLAQQGSKFDDRGGKVNDPIDIRNITPALNQILDIPETGATMVELKNSPNQQTLNNIAYKILKERKLYSSAKSASELKRESGFKRIGKGSMDNFATAAGGQIPNLVDFTDKRFKLDELPNLPQGLQEGVNDAVKRESQFVPKKDIRVDFPSKQNMPPVAVTNTRDEGNFASASTSVATGIRKRKTAYRQANMSGNPMLAGTNMEFAAGGVVPNFVINPTDLSSARNKAQRQALVNDITQSLEDIEKTGRTEPKVTADPKQSVDAQVNTALKATQDAVKAAQDSIVENVRLDKKSILTNLPAGQQGNEQAILKDLQKLEQKTQTDKRVKNKAFSEDQSKRMQDAKSLADFDAVVEERLQQSKEEFERKGDTSEKAKGALRQQQDRILKQAGYDIKTPKTPTIQEVRSQTISQLPDSDVKTKLKKQALQLVEDKGLTSAQVDALDKAGVEKDLGGGKRGRFKNKDKLEIATLKDDAKAAILGATKVGFAAENPEDVKAAQKTQEVSKNQAAIQERAKKAKERTQRSREISITAAEKIAETKTAGETVRASQEPKVRKNIQDQIRALDVERFDEQLQESAKGVLGESASKIIPKSVSAYEAAFGAEDVDDGATKGKKVLNDDIKRALQTQTNIEQSNVDEAQKGLNKQQERIRTLEQETKAGHKNKTLTDDQVKARKQIVQDLKAQRKAQQTAFNKQFQKGMYNPALQNIGFAAPFALSMASGFLPEGEGGTAGGQATGALQGAAQGGSLGTLALMGGINPLTIGIAAGSALVGGIVGAMKKATPSADELTKRLKNLQAATTANINSATQYVKIQEQINNAINSGDVKMQEKLMDDIKIALNEIVDPEIRQDLLDAGNDMSALGSIIGELGAASRTATKELEFLEGFRQNIDSRKTLTNLYGTLGRGDMRATDKKALQNQLTATLDINDLGKVAELREAIFASRSIEELKDNLVKLGGLDAGMVDDLIQDAGDFADIIPIISGALNAEAEQIKDSQLFEVLQRETSAIKNYDAALTRVANSLSSQIDRVADYFESISSLAKTAFNENLEFQKSAGVISSKTARERQIDFNTEQIRASQGMQAEKLVKNFVSEVKSEDFDGSSMLEAAYNTALGDFAQSGNSEALLRDVVLISQRSVDANHLTADTINEIGTKQIDIEREMANQLKDLSAKSAIQIAALHLNNRLAERREILSGAPQAAQMQSEDVFNFKRLGTVLQAQGQPSVTSQDQIAALVTEVNNFLEARNIEATPEFRDIAMDAQQSQILTNAARTLTTVPGLDFVNPGDTNYGFGTRDKMFEFFNLQNLQQAPTEGPDLISRREGFFTNEVTGAAAEQQFLNERLFGTDQYQQFTAEMDPANKKIFDESMSSILLGFRDIIVEQQRVRQEAKIPNFDQKQTNAALVDAFGKAGLDFEGTGLESMSPAFVQKTLAQALEQSPTDIPIITELGAQTRILTNIEKNTQDLKDLRDFSANLEALETAKETSDLQKQDIKDLTESQQKLRAKDPDVNRFGLAEKQEPKTFNEFAEQVRNEIKNVLTPEEQKQFAEGNFNLERLLPGGDRQIFETSETLDPSSELSAARDRITFGKGLGGSFRNIPLVGGRGFEPVPVGGLDLADEYNKLSEKDPKAAAQLVQGEAVPNILKADVVNRLLGSSLEGDLNLGLDEYLENSAQKVFSIAQVAASNQSRDFSDVDKGNETIERTILRVQEKLGQLPIENLEKIDFSGLSTKDFKLDTDTTIDEITRFQKVSLEQTGEMELALNQAATSLKVLEGRSGNVDAEQTELVSAIDRLASQEFLLKDDGTLKSGAELSQGVKEQEAAAKALRAAAESLTKAVNNLPVRQAPAPQSTGYVPSFTSQTQVVNQLAKQPEYKMAMERERKASGSIPVIEHSKMLGMHAVYNKEQQSKYGSLDSAIRRDHLAMGQDRNTLYMTGSGKERYFNTGFVPSFFYKKSPAEKQGEDTEQKVIEHEKAHDQAAGIFSKGIKYVKKIVAGYTFLDSDYSNLTPLEAVQKAVKLYQAAKAPEDMSKQTLSKADREVAEGTAGDALRFYSQIENVEEKAKLRPTITKIAADNNLTVPTNDIEIGEAQKDQKTKDKSSLASYVANFAAPTNKANEVLQKTAEDNQIRRVMQKHNLKTPGQIFTNESKEIGHGMFSSVIDDTNLGPNVLAKTRVFGGHEDVASYKNNVAFTDEIINEMILMNQIPADSPVQKNIAGYATNKPMSQFLSTGIVLRQKVPGEDGSKVLQDVITEMHGSEVLDHKGLTDQGYIQRTFTKQMTDHFVNNGVEPKALGDFHFGNFKFTNPKAFKSSVLKISKLPKNKQNAAYKELFQQTIDSGQAVVIDLGQGGAYADFVPEETSDNKDLLKQIFGIKEESKVQTSKGRPYRAKDIINLLEQEGITGNADKHALINYAIKHGDLTPQDSSSIYSPRDRFARGVGQIDGKTSKLGDLGIIVNLLEGMAGGPSPDDELAKMLGTTTEELNKFAPRPGLGADNLWAEGQQITAAIAGEEPAVQKLPDLKKRDPMFLEQLFDKGSTRRDRYPPVEGAKIPTEKYNQINEEANRQKLLQEQEAYEAHSKKAMDDKYKEVEEDLKSKKTQSIAERIRSAKKQAALDEIKNK